MIKTHGFLIVETLRKKFTCIILIIATSISNQYRNLESGWEIVLCFGESLRIRQVNNYFWTVIAKLCDLLTLTLADSM